MRVATEEFFCYVVLLLVNWSWSYNFGLGLGRTVLVSFPSLTVCLCISDTVHCGKMIHPAAKVSEPLNVKCPPWEYDFSTFNLLN